MSFSLQNMPTVWSSATWTIKQNGVTKASGTGTSSSANNLTDGKVEVSYIVSFGCGLESITISKDFWFGKPVPSVIGSDEIECYSPEWYFIDPESYKWGEYQWSTDNNLEILSTTTGHKAEIQGLDEGYGQIFLEVTNSCGSNENRLVVDVNCSRFLLSPNPASENLQINVIYPKNHNIEITDEFQTNYKVSIYDLYGVFYYSEIRSGSSFSIPVSNLKNGNYSVRIEDGKRISVLPLIINH